MLRYMPMMTSKPCVPTIGNGIPETGGGAVVRAAGATAEAPRSGRGRNRFSQQIGGHPRALRAASPPVMLGLVQRAPPPPRRSSFPSARIGQDDESHSKEQMEA